MRLPATTNITLDFGSTKPPYSTDSPHRGTDFAYIPDNIIYAPFTGRVTQVLNNGRDGNGTYMVDDQGRRHGLLHASKFLVPNGSVVQEGQPIAVMGFSGFVVPSGPLGAHLHWCVQQDGVFIDPMSLIQGEDMVDDSIARRLYSLSTLMAQPGLSPDRQPTEEEIKNLIGKPVAQACDELMNTSPWGGNWNKVKHYDEDLKAAADSAGGAVLKPGNYKVV